MKVLISSIDKDSSLNSQPAKIFGNAKSFLIYNTDDETFSTVENNFDFNQAVEDFQKNMIIQALQQTNWVKSKAAHLLKMNRTTLVEKIKKMNLKIENTNGSDMMGINSH